MPTSPGILILVRHGQTQWNLENRFTGWVDVPLSPTGEDEARRAGELLREMHFDRAFISTQVRAEQTLRILLDVIGQPDVPVERDAALNERHYGMLQGLNKEELARLYGEEQIHVWQRSYQVAPPGGESLHDTAERVMPYVEARILPLVQAGQHILVVAHGNSLRALIMALDGISEDDIPDLYIPWAVPLRYVIDSEGRILERGYLGKV